MIDWKQTKHRMQANEAALERALGVDPGRVEEILRQRAAQLAARQTNQASEEPREPVLVFSLGTEQYAIEVEAVAEVFSLTRCSPVPGAPPELLGVINHRGEVLSIVDLARLLALPEHERPKSYVVVVRRGDLEVGFEVDQLERIALVALESSLAPGDDGGQLPVRYVRGVTPDRLIVLDLLQILDHPVFTNESL